MVSFLYLLAAAGAAQAATVSSASEAAEKTLEPSIAQIKAEESKVKPLSPKSNVKGLAFDRFFQVWLENTDYSAAAGDPNQKALAKMGITLTNYYGTTHPSEPNYCAAAGGDNFGMDNDDFHAIPANISTVADLLDTKGISWAEYQEDIPYAGFQGYNYSDQDTFANDYVRKHDPLILFKSVTNNATRLSLIKSFVDLQNDVIKQQLPQWAFITPNMTNDAHDTNVTFASVWERAEITAFLADAYADNNTLVLLTWDEDESYSEHNAVFSILLGGAVPTHLRGTKDHTFYNHYSTIASVSQNWGLPSLGRWDCHANVFSLVAQKSGYKNYDVDTTNLFFNASYPGPVSDLLYTPHWPNPTTDTKCAHGKGVLPAVKKTWGHLKPSYNYNLPYPNGGGLNMNGKVSGGPGSA